MTRPKVDPDKRQRTAQACDSCKRRKQKCDGQSPCATCVKRRFECTYDNASSSTERQESTFQSPSSTAESTSKHHTSHGSEDSTLSTQRSLRPARSASGHVRSGQSFDTGLQQPGSDEFSIGGSSNPVPRLNQADDFGQKNKMPARPSHEQEPPDEEVDNHTMARMLDDGHGRLLYVGDSATLSFLQLLRMIVETVAGPSGFSMDPYRHQITEPTLDDLKNINASHLLPDKPIALILVQSFFTNTHGMLEIYDEQEFELIVERCYSRPQSIERQWLCHFHLVMAIGLCLATPKLGSNEWGVVERLRAESPARTEVFYVTAKSLADPIARCEDGDGDMWSIQALVLLAVYMLIRSKRNASYLFIGMAIRSGYAIGLHRGETSVVFLQSDQKARRRIWRSLFVLDRFLAVSLGRPVAIAEEDSSGDAIPTAGYLIHDHPQMDPHHLCATGLEATIRSCHIMGAILRRVYYRRKISLEEAQALSDLCKEWPRRLSPDLHWRQATPEKPRQSIAILHCNIFYWHTVILLTRPFFLYLLSIRIQRDRLRNDVSGPRRTEDMEKFSEACMIASRHTVATVENAYAGGYLPRLNPFPTYCLFAAALVLYINEFAKPSSTGEDEHYMRICVEILQFCGKMDPQAHRAALVLQEFSRVIQEQNQPVPFNLHQGPLPSMRRGLSSTISMEGSLGSFSDPDTPYHLPVGGDGLHPAGSGSFANLLSGSGTSLHGPGQQPFSTSDMKRPEYPFSGLIDFEDPVLPTASEMSSNLNDENFNFESYWQWPESGPLPDGDFSQPGILP